MTIQDIKEGAKFKVPWDTTIYTIHKITPLSVQVTGGGEMVEYTTEEFDVILKSLKYE